MPESSMMLFEDLRTRLSNKVLRRCDQGTERMHLLAKQPFALPPMRSESACYISCSDLDASAIQIRQQLCIELTHQMTLCHVF